MASWNTDLRRFVTTIPLPEVVAQLLQTDRLKFHNDHLFYKESGSLVRTAFHQDASYFAMRGEQVAICWVPVDVVTKASGAMGYVRGSHRWPDAQGRPGVVFQPKNLVTEQRTQPLIEMMPKGMPELPDIEGNEAKYDVVYFDASPGDVIIHHMKTVHGSAGNTSAERHRRAASIRYIGDDVVYDHPQAGSMVAVSAFLTPSKHGGTSAPWADGNPKAADEMIQQVMKPGDPLEDPTRYPLSWPRPPSRL